MQRSQITVFRIGWRSSFEVMDGEIFVPFSFGVPQHRCFNRLDFVCFDGVDLAFALEFITGAINSMWMSELQTDQWLDHDTAWRGRLIFGLLAASRY